MYTLLTELAVFKHITPYLAKSLIRIDASSTWPDNQGQNTHILTNVVELKSGQSCFNACFIFFLHSVSWIVLSLKTSSLSKDWTDVSVRI